MIGRTLAHYEILEKLGAGGMGEVYRAFDSRLDREVALKLLPPEVASDPEWLARFEREAKMLAALDHPGIVAIHAVEEAEGLRFLTMQLVKGQRLSELIPRGGMPLQQFFGIAIPLADALAAAHDKQVIHRDLKPGNIMVGEDGRVKVLDFGLAKQRRESPPYGTTQMPTDTLTAAGSIMGTVPYMSPEQLEGEKVDAPSDIFSLGVILYLMAAGEAPFSGDSSASMISSILRDTPREVASLRTDLPQHLGRIIKHCLEKDPERRFQSAKDVRNELQGLQREVAILEGSDASVISAPPRRWSGTRWALTAALVLAAMSVATLGLYLAKLRTPPGVAPGGPVAGSLAVLPLANLSGDPEQEYFADGMTEALITDLAKISALKVISRTSVMQYKNIVKPLGQIARELGVETLVEGSVLRAGDRVRITAQLIHAATDQHLWAESYERDLTDVLALQKEVARAIADEIRVVVTPEERSHFAAPGRVDAEAYEAYLKARFQWNKRTWESLGRARELFEQALERDPDWALAYAGLADTYGVLGSYGFVPPGVAYPRAKAAASRALAADGTIAEAHASLGWVNFTFDWDWTGADRELRRAIELNPSYATARHWYALFLEAIGRPEEALQQIRLARDLDPLSLIINTNLGWILYFERRWDEALNQYESTLELDPHFAPALWKVATTYGEMGRYAEALEKCRTGMELYGWNATQLAQLLAKSGQEHEARRLLRQLRQESERSYVNASEIAAVYAALDDQDQALNWLEKAYEERDGALAFLRVEPRFDSLRADPRFGELLRRMGLPE